MAKKILVATPHPAFGELLRISLEENGPYQVRLVQSGKEAQSIGARNSFAMAILDCDLNQPGVVDVARSLQDRIPDMRLMVIPLESDGSLPDLDGVRVDGTVSRPYYLPDLLQSVQNILTPSPQEPPSIENPLAEEAFQWQPELNPSLPWQNEASRATDLLESMLKECSADSLVVARLRSLYAFAGRLSAEGATGIANELARYWDSSQKSDLVRFLTHDIPEQDSLLYATALAEDFILALVYDVPIPLTRCRAQAGKLVRLMMTPVEVEEVPPSKVESIENAQPPAELIPLEQLLAAAQAETSDEEQPVSEEDEEAMAASLASLLSSMPQPDPALPIPAPGGTPALTIQNAFQFPWELAEAGETEPLEEPPAQPEPSPTQPENEELPVWLREESEPVSPFSEPVVEEIWWSAIPQAEQALPPELPAVPTPQILVQAEPPTEPRIEEMPAISPPPTVRPAWMDAATQPLTAAELPVLDLIPESSLPAKPGDPIPPLPGEAALTVDRELEVADTQPFRIKEKAQPKPVEQPSPHAEEIYQGETRQVRARRKTEPMLQEDTFLADTRPRKAQRPAALEPATVRLPAPPSTPPPGSVCTCVLIPYIPEHFLVGGMADMLKQALVKAAAQNHWKISRVIVRPQYLQWTTETPEVILPEKVAEQFRKRLSAMIFKQYPTLKKHNRSGNFWSTEALALQGPDTPPAQRLRAFTRQVRAQSEVSVQELERS